MLDFQYLSCRRVVKLEDILFELRAGTQSIGVAFSLTKVPRRLKSEYGYRRPRTEFQTGREAEGTSTHEHVTR